MIGLHAMDHLWEIIVAIVQLLLLFSIMVLWLLARRDLTAESIKRQAPAVDELKELRETIEQLITVLEERATAAEARLEEAEARVASLVEGANSIEREALQPPPAPVAVVAKDRAVAVAEALEAVASAQGSTDSSLEPTAETIVIVKPKPRARAPRKSAAARAAVVTEPVVEATAEVVAGSVVEPVVSKLDEAVSEVPVAEAPGAEPEPPATKSSSDPYAKVYEMVDAGITDRVEIARTTGFGLSEVDLVLTMRPRV